MAQVHIDVIREARDFVAFVEQSARERIQQRAAGAADTRRTRANAQSRTRT